MFLHLPKKLAPMGRNKKVGEKEILEAIALSPDPIVTAAELAQSVDYSPDGMRNRLQELYDDGLVNKKDVGARATVWWISEDGRDRLA